MDYNKLLRPLLLFAAALIFVGNVYAQQTVNGVVTDSKDGLGIPGVTVLEKGTSNGTVTDFDGNYTLRTTANGATLVFSYIGYLPQEFVISGGTINVSLSENLEELGEVVVIGYGTVKKGDATGSVTAIGSDDFNQGAITSPQELLMGKAAGVVITSSGGAPGSGSTIRIRGGSSLRATNDPLIVIDGIPVDDEGIGGSSNPLSMINPNDIETFTVLKDASATAIYGSRASNGVIIITTKKGKAGSSLKISYNGNLSIGVPVEFMDVLTGDEMRALVNDRVTNNGLNAAAIDRMGTANTDWQAEIYQNAISQDHNVSFTGSYKTLPYRVSYGFTDQSGTLKYSNMQRHTGALNLSPSLLNDALKINFNVKASLADNDFSNTDAIGAAVQMDPTQSVMSDDPNHEQFGGYFTWTELSDPTLPNNIATHNPVARLEFRSNTSTVKRLTGNIQFDYTLPFLTDVHLNLNAGIDNFNSEGDDVIHPNASWGAREPNRNVLHYNHSGKNELIDFYANYTKTVADIHSIGLMAGYSWQHFYREGETMNHRHLADGETQIPEEEITLIDYKKEFFLVSFFGRLNYTLMDKYLITATVRQDGSSRVSEENRWGIFPSFAGAWKIKNESFLNTVDVVTDLKLRVGYGLTGQQDISDDYYPYYSTYQISTDGAYYQFGDNFYPTLRPNRYDANIKWEETTTQNIGLDFGFANDRIVGSFDYYKRETTDLINEIPIPVGTNFSNQLITNVGSLENTGYEATLTLRPIAKTDMGWEISLNYSHNENEITSLTLVDDPNYVGYDVGGISGGVGNNVQINSVGYPANTFLLFSQVYDANGNPIEGLFVDKTGEGGSVAGNNANKYYLGTPVADYVIGASTRFNYKDFDFSCSGRLSMGNYVYNNNASNMALYQNLYNQSGYLSNVLTSVSESGFNTAQYHSDFYIEDASFFRMDNMTVGYNINKIVTEKLRGRVSFTVQNAFVITDYTGLDPEVSSGIDNNIFPRPRTFMLGLNLEF